MAGTGLDRDQRVAADVTPLLRLACKVVGGGAATSVAFLLLASRDLRNLSARSVTRLTVECFGRSTHCGLTLNIDNQPDANQK